MTDRELLELAAKAAGTYYVEGESWDENAGWNPLTDDGDALRLAVRLNIGVQSHAGSGDYSLADSGESPVVENHNDDPAAATRRAIVRAAAEIGKAMT